MNFIKKIAKKIDKILKSNTSSNDYKVYCDSIIRNEKGQILLLQRSYNDDFEPAKWALPGGKLEQGETPLQASQRELLEETNLKCQLNYIGTVKRKDSETHYFEGYIHTSQCFPILDNEEHYHIEWVDIDKLYQYDLILDLYTILTEILHIPLFNLVEFETMMYNVQDAIDRNIYLQKCFNQDIITVKQYFEYKDKLQQLAFDLLDSIEDSENREKLVNFLQNE